MFFQEVVIIHEEEEMQFSDLDGGSEKTFIDFYVNPLARANLAGGGRDEDWREETWQVNSCCPPRSNIAGGCK